MNQTRPHRQPELSPTEKTTDFTRSGMQGASARNEGSVLVLLAERDRGLRKAMALALKGVGCKVRQCSNAVLLKTELRSGPILSAQRALLVLRIELAARCTRELQAMAVVRSKARLGGAALVLVRDSEGIGQELPEVLGESDVVGLIEMPLDLDELERLVRNVLETSAEEIESARMGDGGKWG